MPSLSFLQKEKDRNIKLTNRISISVALIAVVLGFIYLLASLKIETTFYLTIWLFAPIFLIPYFLNKFGFHQLSRFLVSTILPVAALVVSVINKQGHNSSIYINAVNYFDVRFVIISAAIIPFILYEFDEFKQLILACIPTLLVIIAFDPVHNLFNVGYYQLGLESNDYYFSSNLYTCITFLFISLALIILKYQVFKSEKKQLDENLKIKQYLEMLIKLGNSENILLGRVDNSKKEILKLIRQCLNISRISLWTYDADAKLMECEYILEKDKFSSPKLQLSEADYPAYFRTLLNNDMIIAHDAANNPSTIEFAESYLKPLDIKSMMDVPFLNIGQFGGVICCEQQVEFRFWGAAESMLLKGLGDFLSYTISVNFRREQNKLLIQKNKEISQINENLESKVATRTKELNEKNKQLTEYAYINSHILRAPVARISGLYNLFQMETKDAAGSDILDHMNNSILELEEITYQINRAIEENGSFNRSHLSN